ncbi:MAG TPA: glycosyltransferase [Burkholderiales bacterium]|nr:glycosyltransferase [Burkholderiales bacterium]
MVSGLALGGAERQIVLLSRELACLGHGVSIYTLTAETPRLNELAGAGVEVVIDQKRQRLDIRVLGRLRRHIGDWRPDIVHGFLYDGNLYSRLAGWGTRVPVVNSERNDNYALSLVQRVGYRLTSTLCDGMVANSYAGARFAAALHGLAPGAVDVVWNGIDLREVDARVARSGHPAKQIFPGADVKRLCMVASIKPQKDHPLALRVLRRLLDDDPSWRLICVGDELSDGVQGYKKQVLAERGRLGLEPFVKFVGHRRDVPEIIASSDMLLVTSRHEGFPNVVLESMACGTAVVSTEYSDVRRILPAAQVVGSRAEQDIADAVARCYGRRTEIAKAQRDWVQRHATASASAAALLALYAKYTARAARPVGSSLRRSAGKG